MGSRKYIHHKGFDIKKHIGVVINTPEVAHVYPLDYFRAIIEGESVEPLEPIVLRVILHEWLKSVIPALFVDEEG